MKREILHTYQTSLLNAASKNARFYYIVSWEYISSINIFMHAHHLQRKNNIEWLCNIMECGQKHIHFTNESINSQNEIS